jgi:predicted O-methyltransferase YrrM
MAKFIFIEQDTLQHESELQAMIDFLFDQEEIQTALEIGSYKGGTAYVWLQLVKKKVILIDKNFLDKVYIGKPYFALVCEIEGNSRDEKIFREVESLLNKEQIDFLFIDGDHGYWSVMDDFEKYSQFMRPGGWIAFHDVFNPAWTVRQYWEEIKQRYEYYEFDIRRQPIDKKKTIWGAENPQGIGLLRWKP